MGWRDWQMKEGRIRRRREINEATGMRNREWERKDGSERVK